MAHHIVGNDIVDEITVLDASSVPLTGLTAPTDITLTLHRQSGTVMVVATETISFAEVGATGRYAISFNPDNSGRYVLWTKELHASTFKRQTSFRYDVVTAGSSFAPTYANAFCSEADVERRLNFAIDGTTSPTDTSVAGFAEERAAVLSSLCTGWGFPVSPPATAGTRLEDLLRAANAIGTAQDTVVTYELGRSVSLSEKPLRLMEEWDRFVGTPDGKQIGYLQTEIQKNQATAAFATDHVVSGDTAADSSTTPAVNEGIQIGMGDKF